MKKVFACMLAVFLIAALLTGCGETKKSDKLTVVTTIFPTYDWMRQIVGEVDTVEVTLLQGQGVDLHSYQPTADDIICISNCDVFVYVGGESDEWVEDVLEQAKNPNLKAVSLLDTLGDRVKAEELVEGMQGEDEEEHDHEDEEEEWDEHVWLSLKNAKILCSSLADTFSAVDTAHADVYKANAAAYGEKLDALDGQYQAAVEAGTRKTVLVGDRFPFRYLVDDYGLSYYAAFVGCSAESEASFETILFLANKMDELHLTTVLTLEGSDQKIARTVVENTAGKSAQILVLNSLQSVTAADVKNGTTYLAVMEENLDVLRQALK